MKFGVRIFKIVRSSERTTRVHHWEIGEQIIQRQYNSVEMMVLCYLQTKIICILKQESSLSTPVMCSIKVGRTSIVASDDTTINN